MHQVDWEPSALDMLALICLQKPNRWPEINSAADIIEFRLQRDPISHSRHVAEELRRIDVSPLAAYFAVTGSQVTIGSLRWIGG